MNPIATAVLIALKKILPQRYQPALKDFFVKGTITFQTEEVAFDKIKSGRKLAPLVSPMVAGKPNTSKGGTLTSIRPAYVKSTDVVTSNRIVKRAPGEALLGNQSSAARLNAIRADILTEQEASIDRREEWMVAEVLKTGGVTLTGESFEDVYVDYQRSKENNVTLSGVDKWAQLDKETSHKPIDDIEDWAERCNSVADTIVMGKTAWREFRSFKCVKDVLDIRRGSNSKAEIGSLNNKSFKYVGSIGEFNFYVYSGAYEDEQGTDQLYVDKNGVMVLPSEIELYMAYGAIQDVKACASGFVEASRYPSSWLTDNPSAEWLQTQAAPIPVLLDADDVCYARV